MHVTWRLLLMMLFVPSAHAQFSGFPYTTRLYPYQGWSAIVRGDNNTIGMAGATVALPTSIAAMESNPAGLAMHLGGLAAQINSNTIKNPELNRTTQTVTEVQWGLGANIPPWGYAITYYSPSTERVNISEVSVRQFRASLARLIGTRLSIGVTLQLEKGIRKFDGRNLGASQFSYQVGALYKLEDHWVIGASFRPANDILPDTGESSLVNSFGFNQSIRIPSIIAVGVGFLPNRFFRAGASVHAVSGTGGTALLYDQSVPYGQDLTFQPRVGASYIFADYRWIRMELAVGLYDEISRVRDRSDRLHGTFGLDVNPWFINAGVGADLAVGYQDFRFGIGIDLVRTMRTLDLIPADPVPPYNGFFPRADKISADGLSDSFTHGEKKTVSPSDMGDVQKIVEDIPRRVREKLRESAPKTRSSLKPKKKPKKKKGLKFRSTTAPRSS